jgi:hypothetical protein
LSGFPPEHLGIGNEIAMEGGWQFDGQLHRPIVGERAELEFEHGGSPH